MDKIELAQIIHDAIPTDTDDFEAVEALQYAMDRYISSIRYDRDHD